MVAYDLMANEFERSSFSRDVERVLRETRRALELVKLFLAQEREVASAVDRKNVAGGKKPAGRRLSDKDISRRAEILSRWHYFRATYGDLPTPSELGCPGVRQGTVEHFTAWAVEEYDDMPSDDPAKIERLIKAEQKRQRDEARRR
jgi:hypothetical protein